MRKKLRLYRRVFIAAACTAGVLFVLAEILLSTSHAPIINPNMVLFTVLVVVGAILLFGVGIFILKLISKLLEDRQREREATIELAKLAAGRKRKEIPVKKYGELVEAEYRELPEACYRALPAPARQKKRQKG
jgi:hypothetical protein